MNDKVKINHFIEKNYFQDYVDEKLEVKPFFEGHSWTNPKVDGDEFDAFF